MSLVAKMPSSSKLLVMMLFSFLALFIISHANQVVFSDTPSNSYAPPIYSPVPDECFKTPNRCRPPGESQFDQT
ncbi:PREDICTED: uncharacterized protein LOC104713361 [Camelina sativa]|uniref:Uncharacterized protein LOC104713361 n=1 Tax=Camelina sativa TaxID=90675 RepID=A0ABM1QG27_CAMSA|nr:PREDICTED: uncharacterized protein LOC104713361 [Camelina sativa]